MWHAPRFLCVYTKKNPLWRIVYQGFSFFVVQKSPYFQEKNGHISPYLDNTFLSPEPGRNL